jgi:hypothetical protein
MRKTSKNGFRKKNKSLKKRNHNLSKIKNKKQKTKNGGGKYGTLHISQNNLEDIKNKLVDSFDLFNEIYDSVMKNKSNVPYYLKYKLTTYIDGLVMVIYSNLLTYNYFDKFYNKLIDNDIIKCDGCIDYTISIPGTRTALYKIFKIYFVIGFIIAYYYRNPSKFINEEYLNKMGINNTILYLFKDIVSILLCKVAQSRPECNMIDKMEKFIEKNQINVDENTEITRIIFNFILKIPFVENMEIVQKFVDIKLRPPEPQ